MNRAFLRHAFLTLVCACTVTDTGNPPASPTVDGDLLDVESTTGGGTTFRGAAGAVVPEEGFVHLTPFGVTPALIVAVEADGAFEGEVPIDADEDLVRVQVVQGALRSAPIDIGRDGVIQQPRPACLAMRGSEQVVLDESGQSVFTLMMTNECPDTLEFGAPSLRLASGPFELIPDAIEPLAPSESREVEVRIRREVAGADILFLPITAPTSERRAVTLVVREL